MDRTFERASHGQDSFGQESPSPDNGEEVSLSNDGTLEVTFRVSSGSADACVPENGSDSHEGIVARPGLETASLTGPDGFTLER